MLADHLLKDLHKIGEGAIYFVFGLFMLFLGRLIWEAITRYKINKEIFDADNESAGIAEFGFLIALAIIILASLKEEAGTVRPALYIDLISSFIYSVFGLIALAVAKFVLDIFTPNKMDDEISKDRNPAAAWLQSGFYIAIAIIIYGIM